MDNRIKEQKSIVLDRHGQAHEVAGSVTVPPGEARIDWCAVAARVERKLNWLMHNPTPGSPRQGRKLTGRRAGARFGAKAVKKEKK